MKNELSSSAETDNKTTCNCAEQQQRIAELEAKLETAMQSMLAERARADAAKAKLAMVKELAEGSSWVLIGDTYVVNTDSKCITPAEILKLVSDARKPLAVMEGYVEDAFSSGCQWCRVHDNDSVLSIYKKSAAACDIPVTVIVMPKEGE
jgi:hypothetical protein